jgi:hypothetical protein
LTLVGRAVALHPRPRATVFSARDIHNVSFASGFLPTLVTGVIRRGHRGVHRNLALVVNGRVSAVTRTFYLRGSRRESFAALVPESAFHPGRNSVIVLAVAGRGLRLRFRLLGGV